MQKHTTAQPARPAYLGSLALALALGVALPTAALGLDPDDDTKRVCPSGQTWSGRLQKCVGSDTDRLIDEERTRLGRALARDGRYQKAIEVLNALQRQDDPIALTYLGYSHRKLGGIALGISYYHKALAIDPDNVDAREYLGEGYLAAGQPDLARLQLAEIAQRCGTGCEAYQELQAALEGRQSARIGR